MKKFSLLLCLTMLLFASCIKDEAPNAEADIVKCSIEGVNLIRPAIIENERVILLVDKNTNISNLAPTFELTPGATIEPASGTALNFIIPQTYTVTSEDKKWTKTYTIIVTYDQGAITNYQFEGLEIKEQGKYHYHVIQEIDQQGAVTMSWASGNSGYVTAAGLDELIKYDPTLFPTYSFGEGRNGKCAVMVTRKPKSSLVANFAPIAAGNLFTGTFKIESISKPAKGTHFGEGNIFRYYPVSLEGYYKYKAGPEVLIKNPQPGKDYTGYTDTWDIYGVLYDATKTPTGKDGKPLGYLDGYNILNDPSIVMVARLPREKRVEADEWTYFFVNFIPFEGGTPLDKEKLKNGVYNLAIVMSSSEEGAFFNGAENSTLYVDDVELKYLEEF